MKSSILLSILAAGILAAQPATQAPAQPQSSQPQAHAKNRGQGGQMMGRLTRRLGLSPDQVSQAQSIFANARSQRKALAPQLKSEHQAMQAAVKSDNEAQIDQVTSQNAQLNSQVRAIHAKAMAKFYSILTPDQKAKFDQQRVNAAFRGRARMLKKNG